MRPYQIVVAGRRVGLTVAGVKHEHFFGLAVVIPVVCAEVDRIFCQQARVANHVRSMVIVVHTVVTIGLRQPDGAHYIKRKVKLSTALRREIVAYAAAEIPLVIAFVVGNVRVKVLRVRH